MMAATVIVTKDAALLWTDGRYFLQAESQLHENWTLMKDGMEIINIPPILNFKYKLLF